METVNRIVVSGLVFGPVEFTEPDRGPAHARFCLSQEKAAGSRRVEHRFHCVAFGPVAMAVAASLAPGVAVVLEGELAEARAAGRARSRYRLSSRSTRADSGTGPMARAFFIPHISIHTHVRICAYAQPHIFDFAHLCDYASAHLGRYRHRMRARARDG